MNPRFIHIAAVALLAAAPARAQAPADPSSSPPTTQSRGAGAILLHPEPFQFPGLGMSISLPQGAVVNTTTAGRTESFSVQPPDNTWLLSFQEKRSRDLQLTANAVADEVLGGIGSTKQRAALGSDPKKAVSEVQVIDRQPNLQLGGVPAARFYIAVPEGDSRIIHAYTVFQAEPGRFVLARMQCLEPELPRARLIYEAVVASAKFEDPIASASDRAAAILAGEGLLGELSVEDYDRALLPTKEWRRLYRPAVSGAPIDAQEIAYQSIEIRRGNRGDLTPERPPERWSATEKQEGYVVRVAARYLDGARIIDSESVFFATLALSEEPEEAWTVRLRIREGKNSAAWTETGARYGDRLSVRVQAEGAAPTETTWTLPDRGYLSQVESYMLPRLLAQAKAPLVFSFYCYNSTTNKLELRRDVMESAADAAGGWIIHTRLTEGMAERETLLTADGELIKTTTADGVVMEPIEVDRLHTLWKNKNLLTAN